LVAFLCGAKIRVGPAFKSRWNLSGWCFTHTIIWDRFRHAVENNLDNLRMLGFTDFITELKLSVNGEHRRIADDFLIGSNLSENEMIVGMHPGGASGCRLYWPASRFAEVARFIIDSHKFRLAVFFGPGETNAASAFYGLPIIPVIGLRFGVVCGIIEKCAFFISADTGLGHVAAALRKPTFTVFGNANQRKHHPWGNSSYWINKLPPSLFTGIETAYLAGEAGRKALESVSVEEVILRLDPVLKEISTYVPRFHEIM
jgi:ADP-heptose:LPS heptosyltransferase